jgi:hypothetical protein
MTEVRVVQRLANPADLVWAMIGDFGGLHRWHPQVSRVDLCRPAAAQDRRSATPHRAGAAAARSARSAGYSTGRLRGGGGGVVDRAGLVFVERDLGAAGGVAHGGIQHLGLLGEDAQAGKIVLHVLECRQYGATIVGDRRFIGALAAATSPWRAPNRTRFRSRRRPATRHGWRRAAGRPAAIAKSHPRRQRKLG